MFGRRINDRITKEGVHCDLCGSSSPAVRCEKCNSQIFCLSCDDMYHRHPKRNLHVRRALDAIMTNKSISPSQLRPPLPPKGEMVPTPVPPPRKHKRFGFGKSPTPILGRREPSSGSLGMLNFGTIKKPDFSIREKVGSLKKLMGSRPLPPPPNDVPPQLKSITLNRSQSERVRPPDAPPTPPPVSTIPRKNSLVEHDNMTHQSITEAAIPLTVVEMTHRETPSIGRGSSFRSVHNRSQMSDASFSDTRSRAGSLFGGGFNHQQSSAEEPNGRVMPHHDGWGSGRRRFGGGMMHSTSVFDLSAAVPPNPFPPPQPAFAPLSQAQSVAHLNCPSCRMMWMNSCHHHQHPAQMIPNPWGYPQSYVSGDGTMRRTPSNMSMNIGPESVWGYPPQGMMGMPMPRSSSPTQSVRSRRSSRPRRRRYSSESDDYSASSEGEEPKPNLRSRRGSKVKAGPWECKHCTFVNPETSTVCSVCCKTNVMENGKEKQHKPARFNRLHERRRTIGIVPSSDVIKSNLSFNIKDKEQADTKVHLHCESAPPPQSEDDSLGSRLEESLAFTVSESAKQSSKTDCSSLISAEEDTGEDLEQIPLDEEQRKTPASVYTSRFMVNVNPSAATEIEQQNPDSFYKAPLTASPNPDEPDISCQDPNSIPSPVTQPLSSQSLEVPCQPQLSVETPLTNGDMKTCSPMEVDQSQVPVQNVISSTGVFQAQQPGLLNGVPEVQQPGLLNGVPEVQQPSLLNGVSQVQQSDLVNGMPQVQHPGFVNGVPQVQQPGLLNGVPQIQQPNILNGVPQVQQPGLLNGVPQVQQPGFWNTLPQTPCLSNELPDIQQPGLSNVLTVMQQHGPSNGLAGVQQPELSNGQAGVQQPGLSNVQPGIQQPSHSNMQAEIQQPSHSNVQTGVQQPGLSNVQAGVQQPGLSNGLAGVQQVGVPNGQVVLQQPGFSNGQIGVQQPGFCNGQAGVQQPGFSNGQAGVQQPGFSNGVPEVVNVAPSTHTIAVGPSEALTTLISVGPTESVASGTSSHSIAVGPSPEGSVSPVKITPTSVSTSTSPLPLSRVAASPKTLRKPVESEKKLISTGTSPPPQTIATQTTDITYGSLDRRRRGGWGSGLKRAASFSMNHRWEDIPNRRGMVNSGSQSQLDSPSSRECTPPPYSRWNPNRRDLPDARHGTDSVESSGYGSHGSYSQLRLEDQRSEPVRSNKKDYYLSLEELVQRRKQEAMQKQGLELVRFLREAEEQGFTPEDLQIALNHCGDKTPIRWLMDNLPKMVDTVVTLATNFGHDKGGDNDIGTISQTEAKEALRSTKGNVWAAVTEGVELRRRKFKEIEKRGDFPRDEITKCLSNTNGNVEEALAELNRNQLRPFLLKIWGPPTGTENEAAATTALPTVPVPPEADKKSEAVEQKSGGAEAATSRSSSPASRESKSSSSEREEDIPPVPATTPEIYVTPPRVTPEVPVKPKKVFQTKEAKEQAEFERKVRRLLADGEVQDFRQGEVAVRLMALHLGHSNEDIFEAVKQCGNLDGAISYLEQECGICMGKVPEKKMIAMLMCEHRCCEECARHHFSYRITDRPIQEVTCPFCAEPNLWEDEEDRTSDYYNNLDILLKALVEPKVHELFHTKVTENTLRKDPCFRWCGKCSNGMLMPNPKQKRLECMYCSEVTCGDCQKPWEKQHDGISCEMFQEWKQANDPEFNASGVAKQLAENGIQCPNCKFKCLLAKGGCLHFTCSQCHYEFCSGCGKPFRMGARCNFGPYCEKLGLHAHHPRNCFFYLRDKDIADLQRLLDQHNVPYKTVDADEGKDGNNGCPVIEQKDTADKLEDTMCSKPIEQAGLCRLHYAEYLSSLITRHKLDPIHILSADDLEVVLRRANKRLPRRSIGEAPQLIKENLLNAIREEVPLEI